MTMQGEWKPISFASLGIARVIFYKMWVFCLFFFFSTKEKRLCPNGGHVIWDLFKDFEPSWMGRQTSGISWAKRKRERENSIQKDFDLIEKKKKNGWERLTIDRCPKLVHLISYFYRNCNCKLNHICKIKMAAGQQTVESFGLST